MFIIVTYVNDLVVLHNLNYLIRWHAAPHVCGEDLRRQFFPSFCYIVVLALSSYLITVPEQLWLNQVVQVG